MQLIDLLIQLEAQGQLTPLYKLGVFNIKAKNYFEIVLRYRALLVTPAFIDQPTRAAQATAKGCQVGLRTVYRALKDLERTI